MLLFIAVSACVTQVPHLTNSYVLHLGDMAISELNLFFPLPIYSSFQIFRFFTDFRSLVP